MSNNLIWIDVETTGLDENKHALLEVGMVITNNELVELCAFEEVLPFSRPQKGEVAPVVMEMHSKNGLWDACESKAVVGRFNRADAIVQLDIDLSRMIEKHDSKGGVLANNNAPFDRKWIARFLPKTHESLHYRNIDVSTLKEVFRRFCSPECVYAKAPGAHRALVDVRESIKEFRFYLENLKLR